MHLEVKGTVPALRERTGHLGRQTQAETVKAAGTGAEGDQPHLLSGIYFTALKQGPGRRLRSRGGEGHMRERALVVLGKGGDVGVSGENMIGLGWVVKGHLQSSLGFSLWASGFQTLLPGCLWGSLQPPERPDGQERWRTGGTLSSPPGFNQSISLF